MTSARTRTWSIHTRLFLGFTTALLLSLAVMAVAVYIGMRFLPTYAVTPAIPGDAMPPPEPLSEPVLGARAETKVLRTKEDIWATVLSVSAGAAGVVAALGLAACWLLSRRLLAPLHTISQAAAKAGQGDLSYRINAQGPTDELRRLADTFDDTLARLESSFDAHQRFAANASHELLTPLTTTRTTLQVAMQDASGKELARLAPVLVEANGRSIGIVTELLQLASAEHAQPDPDPVDLGGLVDEVCAELAPRAVTAQVSLESDAEQRCEVTGNAALLRQFVRNLLDNALTHNHPGGWAQAAVYQGDGRGVTVEIANSGPPVSPELTDRLFEPFYRVRSRTGHGHGLGLAIAHSIARAHHATLSATANPDGGLTIRAGVPARTRNRGKEST